MKYSSTPAVAASIAVVEAVGADFAEYRPFANAIAGKLRARDFKGAFAMLDQSEIESTLMGTFAFAQIKAAVSRLSELPGFDPEAKAITRFKQAEHMCKRTNQRLRAVRRRLESPVLIKPGGSVPHLRYIHRAREFVRSVIGDEPPAFWRFGGAHFGPGASQGVGGDATSLLRKLAADEWTVTPSCAPYFIASMKSLPRVAMNFCDSRGDFVCYDLETAAAEMRKKLVYTQEDVLSFVPKKADTHRVIGTQPLGNMAVQLTIGDWMASRLLSFGIDLTDQSVNQGLARKGSVTCGELSPSTLDLAMASDTISRETVRMLLPPAWYSLLNAVRTPMYRFTGSEDQFEYEKFSAMGNGFTFPLETLLFLAICHSVNLRGVGREVFAYGDDLIVPQGDALLTIELLRFFGFRTNTDKTFIFGPFRESCGADYFEGTDIRPAYVKGASLDPLHMLGLHNRLASSKLWVNHDLLRRLRRMADPRIPRTLDSHLANPGAFKVTSESASEVLMRYSEDLQAEMPYVLEAHAVEDPVRVSEDLAMAAVLFGASPSEKMRGYPTFTFRRRRKLKLRWMGEQPRKSRLL